MTFNPRMREIIPKRPYTCTVTMALVFSTAVCKLSHTMHKIGFNVRPNTIMCFDKSFCIATDSSNENIFTSEHTEMRRTLRKVNSAE